MESKTRTRNYELTAGEFQWDIAPGKTVEVWGFNNQLPGPIIEANKGDTLNIKVKNNLIEPTIIHWHGIRLPSSMDGTDDVQKPIEPGEEFTYSFMVPDAGTFWYHSHFNETVQMERGVYGGLIVRDEGVPVTDGEKIFLLDDMKLTGDNNFKEPGWFFARWMERHDGRQGETLLINGKENPVININAGQTERWRFINAASARYFKLTLEGRLFQIIASDGGLLERAVPATEVLITPGERVDILAGPFKEGESFKLESLPYNRMTSSKPKQQTWAAVKVGKSKPSNASIPGVLRKIEPLAEQGAKATREIKFSVGPSLRNGTNFLINNDIHTTDKPVKVGDLQIWEVRNVSLMDHPFHLHGFFFQILEVDGKKPEYISWKDTVNLPPRSRVKIAWMPDNRPGRWMYHCHILEHHEAGMMAHFQVVNDETEIEEAGKHKHAHHHH